MHKYGLRIHILHINTYIIESDIYNLVYRYQFFVIFFKDSNI